MKKQVLFLAVMVLMSLLGNTQVNIANGLLAYYPYTGNANDASGNGYNAYVSGAVLANDRFGNENTSYSLYGDGGNSIYIYSDVPYNFDNDFTYNYWVQSSSNNGTVFYWGIQFPPQGFGFRSRTFNGFNNGSIGSTFLQEFFEPGSSQPFCENYRMNNGGSPSGFFGASWHMLTTVKDGDTVLFYIDGVIVDSGIINSSCDTSSTLSHQILRIGHPDNIGFNTKVDDIMLHSRALNQEEITYLYNLTSSWSQTAALSTLEKKSIINIFPNPGSGMITLSVNQPTTAVFMSANGAILSNLELNGETSIDVSTYAPGIYFIRTAEGQTVKFIKE